MANKKRTINVMGDVLYEIVENDDGISVTIRATEDSSEHITILKSMISTLVESLRDFKN